MKKIVKTKLRTVQAFTPRGGTQLHNPNDNAAPDEPQDDPPTSAQQSFSQPQRHNSGYDPAWSPTPSQNFAPPYQPNHFVPQQQQHQQPAQYYNHAPQQSPPPQQGWDTSNQQQQQQTYSPPYSPHSTQPPQTPPNPTSQPSYMNHSYDPSIHGDSSTYSEYGPSISSTHSQHYPNSPPPMTAAPPTMPSPQRTYTIPNPTHTQDTFYEPPSFQRSQTMPPQYWAHTQLNHDCEANRNTYLGRCSICFP